MNHHPRCDWTAVGSCICPRLYAAEQDAVSATLDSIWKEIERGWDMEPRAQCEEEAASGKWPTGTHPLVVALHYIWKRDPKVQDAYADAERVCREKSPCRADSCQGGVDCPCAAYDECAEAIAARAEAARKENEK